MNLTLLDPGDLRGLFLGRMNFFFLHFLLNEDHSILAIWKLRYSANFWLYCKKNKNKLVVHRVAFCQFLFQWIYYCLSIVVNPQERKLAKRTSVQFTRLTSLDFEISLTISYLFEFQTHLIKCYFKENTNVCILFCNSKLTELDVKMQ